MKRKVLTILSVLSTLSLVPVSAYAATDTSIQTEDGVSTDIGHELNNQQQMLDFTQDRLGYYISYDSEISSNTVIDDAVPDNGGEGDVFHTGAGTGSKKQASTTTKITDNKYFYYEGRDLPLTIPDIRTDYYTFLGWLLDYSSVDSDGNANLTTEAGKDVGEQTPVKGLMLEEGSEGSKHYSSRWRKNYLAVSFDIDEPTAWNDPTASAEGYGVTQTGMLTKDGDTTFVHATVEDGNITFPTLAEAGAALDDYELVAGQPDWKASNGQKFYGGRSYSMYSNGLTTDAKMRAGDDALTLTANYTLKEYTITYKWGESALHPDEHISTLAAGITKGNGNNQALSSIKGSYGSYTVTQKYNVLNNGNLPTPTLEGYVFDGWVYGDSTTGDKISTYKEFFEKSMEDKNNRNETLTATWIPQVYTVTLAIGENGVPTSTQINESFSIADSRIATSNVLENGTATDVHALKADIAEKYAFDRGASTNGKSVVAFTVEDAEDSSLLEDTSSISRDYYTFGGWKNGSTRYDTYYAVANALKSTSNTNMNLDAAWTATNYDFDLKANAVGKATANQVVTKVIGNSTVSNTKSTSSTGTDCISTKTINVENLTNIANPHRDYYNFLGWDYSEPNDGAADILTCKDVFLSVSEKAINGDKEVIVAKFEPKTYDFTFNAGGTRNSATIASITTNFDGRSVTKSATSTTDPSLTKTINNITVETTGTLPTATKTHYSYSGWGGGRTSFEAIFNEVINTNNQNTKVHTVKAKWTPNSYTLSVSNTGNSASTLNTSSHGFVNAKATGTSTGTAYGTSYTSSVFGNISSAGNKNFTIENTGYIYDSAGNVTNTQKCLKGKSSKLTYKDAWNGSNGGSTTVTWSVSHQGSYPSFIKTAEKCETDGLDVYYCNTCGWVEKTGVRNKLGHSWTDVTSRTDKRSTSNNCKTHDTWYKHCGRAGCGVSARTKDAGQYFDGDWGPHTGDDWVRGENPTCTATGWDWHRCTTCQADLGHRSVNSLGHSDIGDWHRGGNPTCTANGWDWNRCSRCGADLGHRDVAATGHNWVKEHTHSYPGCLATEYSYNNPNGTARDADGQWPSANKIEVHSRGRSFAFNDMQNTWHGTNYFNENYTEVAQPNTAQGYQHWQYTSKQELNAGTDSWTIAYARYYVTQHTNGKCHVSSSNAWVMYIDHHCGYYDSYCVCSTCGAKNH